MNAYDDISKPRKGWEHVTTVFVFKHGVVLLCQEKLKGKPGKYKVGKVTAFHSLLIVLRDNYFQSHILDIHLAYQYSM